MCARRGRDTLDPVLLNNAFFGNGDGISSHQLESSFGRDILLERCIQETLWCVYAPKSSQAASPVANILEIAAKNNQSAVRPPTMLPHRLVGMSSGIGE